MVRLVRRYLAHRRGFGYRLQAEGYDLITGLVLGWEPFQAFLKG